MASSLPAGGKRNSNRTVLSLGKNSVEDHSIPERPSLILLLFLVGVLIFVAAPSLSALAGYSPPEGNSIVFDFNPGWKIAAGSYPPDHTDDALWENISAPHTYHETVAYFGLQKGTKPLGPYTYRKHFQIPSEYANRQIILAFDGVRQRGTFYLNGHLLGTHDNGVTPFGFDLTSHLHFGSEDNILQVEVDCGDIDRTSGATMSWFFPGFNPLYGGICRNVRLYVLDKVHATLPLYSSLGTCGTYIYAEDISTEAMSASIGVEAEVTNDGILDKRVTLKAVIVDSMSNPVATLNASNSIIKPGKLHLFTMRQKVRGLHFWQPGSPYLYDVYTEVSVDGHVVDVRRTTTGFRKIEVRGSTLYLNNRALMTMGYTPRSQNEWPAIGDAYPDWLHDYTNKLMVEGNARLVRWEHVMPSPQDVESCDRVGLPQIIPGADRENDSLGEEWNLRKEIMRDTIIYTRNSPSIFLWEAGNNVLTEEHNREMINIRNRWDPHGYRRPMGGRSESPEWVSWMYGVRKEKYRLSEDSEYLRDETARRWWDSYSPPYFHKEGDWKLVDNAGGWNRNQDNMCIMQSIVYEQYYKARPGTGQAVCNGGVQIMFADSDSFSRSVDPFRRSGPVDGMRIPKDTFGCNQTMWSNTPELWTEGHPSVYLPGHWDYPDGTVKPMYIFVSPGIEKVDLLVNGDPQRGGHRTNSFLFTFDDVTWKAGVVEAIGYDASGKAIASMKHETTGQPVALRINVTTGPTGLRADGSDLALIQTEVVDAQGRRCPLAANLIHYDVSGPAIWRGGFWEENVPKYANQKELPVLNGVHRIFIRSTMQPGPIVIKAVAEGLPPVEITLTSVKIDFQGGLAKDIPSVLPMDVDPAPHYGPDLPPAPPPPRHAFDYASTSSSNGETIFGLSTAFPNGADIRHHLADGDPVFKDESVKFQALPPYLLGADYLLVANADATTSAGEGIVFKIGKRGHVYVAYDDRNEHFPVISSPTAFIKTKDSIIINGHSHTLYKSGQLNGGELTYLGTNNWTDKPVTGVNNYVVIVQPDP